MRLIVAILLSLFALQSHANAGAEKARAIMTAVSERPEATRKRAKLRFDLINPNGDVQTREATLLRQIEEDFKKVAMYFAAPRALRNSGFLAWNAVTPELEDEQWLYLPSLRRVRRIPSRDRGQPFLGTDLSYDDIHNVGKLAIDDWQFESAVEVGPERWQVEASAVNEEVAQETGYLRARWTIDTRLDFPIKSEYWDPQDQPLKVAEYSEISERDGDVAADRIDVRNLRNGHATSLRFSEVQVGESAAFDNDLLTPSQLTRGL